MSHKRNQEEAELSVYAQSLKIAVAKGGEARRNVARLLGDVRSFDRPDILITVESGRRLVGIEHFRVDHHIGKGKKVESRSARFSSDAERFRKQHQDIACTGVLTKEAYGELANLIGRAIREQSNACVDDISASLEAGLFGRGGRGHVPKLVAYTEQMRQLDAHADIQLGLLIEFHTDLRQWFLNDGFKKTRISSGKFPLSCEAYRLLKKASAHVDWVVLAFCPLLGEIVHDAVVIRCGNGMFEVSAARQGVCETPYLGLGKEAPFGKQSRQGDVAFGVDERGVNFFVENTSDRMDEIELIWGAMSGAAEACDLLQENKPFAATLSVQLVYDMTRESLRHKKGRIKPKDVLKAIGRMSSSEKNLWMEDWRKRWGINSL